ncbi:hypothetical protein [Endozoicomonas arenosclerae]|uniref:hypothetical protein n=1 Tax=Endozoicomonas arenosclerae TaxID=1633495 RepID=UPI000784366E|nr:hypothetical protein [Endozoicomonas arenosclerae]
MFDHASATPKSILRKPPSLQNLPEAEAAAKPKESPREHKTPLAHRHVNTVRYQYLKSFGTRVAIEYFKQQPPEIQESIIAMVNPAELSWFISDNAKAIFHKNPELKAHMQQHPDECPVDLYDLQTTLANDLLVEQYLSYLRDKTEPSFQQLMTLFHHAMDLFLLNPDYPVSRQALLDNPDLLLTHIKTNFYKIFSRCANIKRCIPPEQMLDHIQLHEVQAQLKASQSRLTYTKLFTADIDQRPKYRTDLEREAGLPSKEVSREERDSNDGDKVGYDMIVGDHRTVFENKLANMTSAAELMTLSFWGDQMAVEESLLDQCDLKLAQLLSVNLTSILVLAPGMAKLVEKCREVLALEEPKRSSNMEVFGQHIQSLHTAELEKMDKTVTRMIFFMSWQGRNHGDVERCIINLRRFYNENPVKYLQPLLKKLDHEFLVQQMATALDSTSEDTELKSSLQEATARAQSLDTGKNISAPEFPKEEKQIWLRRINEAWTSGQSVNWTQPAS